MLLKLRESFGHHIVDVGFDDGSIIPLHSFPVLDELGCATEEVRISCTKCW